MLKALFYIAIIYFAYKLYRAFSQSKVIIKTYHYNDNRQYNKEEEEGKVTIKETPSEKSGTHKSLDKSGEYVDYEEIKE